MIQPLATFTLSTLQTYKPDILKICEKYHVDNIRIFGSVARGQAILNSDIDFLVNLSASWSLLDRIAFTQDLEDLLRTKVDVVIEKNLHWYIRDKILQEAVNL